MSGAVVWITGIPAAGKTTLARAVCAALEHRGGAVRVLDGDELRATVSRDLGFGRDARSENARRASELARACGGRGEVAVIALVSPFAADRDAARAAAGRDGLPFVEVFLDTGLDECRRRDPKGLYAAAAAGRITALTGWDAPYERPQGAEVHIAAGPDGRPVALADAVAQVLEQLDRQGGAGARAPGK